MLPVQKACLQSLCALHSCLDHLQGQKLLQHQHLQQLCPVWVMHSSPGLTTNLSQPGPCSCRDVIHDLDHDAGGCNICGRPDFALGTFCDRTMILCDQCECEFHVGCLRKAARCDLSQLPTGQYEEACAFKLVFVHAASDMIVT